MSTAPYRSEAAAGRDGFPQLLHAEWTKFRTVRGWVIAAFAAAVVMVLLSVLSSFGSHSGICDGPGPGSCHGLPPLPVGPGGEGVTDNYYLVGQPLDGNGSITVRVTSLTGVYVLGNQQAQPGPGGPGSRSGGEGGGGPLAGALPGVQPWAKTGIIITATTRQGSAYAAMMVTGSHGVRMQYNYTHDIAGIPGAVSAASPRWLRLTRSGDTVTGYDSTDGTHWIEVGAARLTRLSTTVPVGMFTTTPSYIQTSTHLFGGSSGGGPAQATGVFDEVRLSGSSSTSGWNGQEIVGPDGTGSGLAGQFQQAGGEFTVIGSGDIAPVTGSTGTPIEHTLAGAFAGLIVVIVLGTIYITSEYRRGLIRTTLAANPRRGRILAAKAIVIASVTFVAGLAGSIVAVVLGEHILRSNGNAIVPVSGATEVRVIVGTAALLAIVGVGALSVGAILRRSAGAVTAVTVAIILPYILAFSSALPISADNWLLRPTPAAAFSIQQSVHRYAQVMDVYTPMQGYYPLAPWAGLAVLCAYAGLAFGVAVLLLRRRDA